MQSTMNIVAANQESQEHQKLDVVEHQVPQIRNQSQHDSEDYQAAVENAEVGTAMTPMASANCNQSLSGVDPAAIFQREEDLTFGSVMNDKMLDVAEIMQVADFDKTMPKSFLQTG